MLALVPRTKPHATARLRRRTLLGIERLETRDCPAAPILTLNARVVTDRLVELSGVVTDEHPASSRVNFTGSLNGTAQPNSSGVFTVLLDANTLGQVVGSVVDEDGIASAPVSKYILNSPPTVTMSVLQNADGSATLLGQVTDESPAGRVVSVSGVAAGSATTDAQGHFKFTGVPAGSGIISAEVLDPWSTQGTASLMVIRVPPEIIDFSASEGSNGTWTFTGHVGHEYAGLEVDFSGLPAVNGQTAVVGDDGNFSLTITLPPNQQGIVWVEITDWFGQTSEQVGAHIVPTR